MTGEYSPPLEIACKIGLDNIVAVNYYKACPYFDWLKGGHSASRSCGMVMFEKMQFLFLCIFHMHSWCDYPFFFLFQANVNYMTSVHNHAVWHVFEATIKHS